MNFPRHCDHIEHDGYLYCPYPDDLRLEIGDDPLGPEDSDPEPPIIRRRRPTPAPPQTQSIT